MGRSNQQHWFWDTWLFPIAVVLVVVVAVFAYSQYNPIVGNWTALYCDQSNCEATTHQGSGAIFKKMLPFGSCPTEVQQKDVDITLIPMPKHHFPMPTVRSSSLQIIEGTCEIHIEN